MNHERFAALIRNALDRASRRGLMRTGLVATIATLLTAGGLTADDALAGNRRRKKRRRRRRRKRRRKKKNRCRGNRPVACGNGCCPENFALCCDDAREATNSHTCNPPTANCCPLDQGGGSCDRDFPLCCDATRQNPFGTCAQVDGVCCPEDLGGGACRVDEPVCCPDPDDPLSPGYCCPADWNCCDDDEECESNNCTFGCCEPVPAGRARAARLHGGRVVQEGGNRFRMPAR